jgi:hypothetical protein
MVSEDSEGDGWLSMIHRLDDLSDLHQAFEDQVSTLSHQVNDGDELVEVLTLRGPQRIRLEERNDHVPDITEPYDAVPEHVFPVVVVAAVPMDPAASEEVDQTFQDVHARASLCHRELRLHLESEFHRATSVDRAAEAALSIDEAENPSFGSQSFLLIFRTSHIVTAWHLPDRTNGV